MNGGVGTATTFLAVGLAKLGHAVDVLYDGPGATEPIDPEFLGLEVYASDRSRIDVGGAHVSPTDARVLETYVSYLRKKLDRHGPPLIHTIRLVGYALRDPSGAA